MLAFGEMDERAVEREYQRQWARARSIVERYPHLDVSGVYHALCNLDRSPEERLRRGLAHGRLGTEHR